MKLVYMLLILPLLATGKKPSVPLNHDAFDHAIATNGVSAAKKEIDRIDWSGVADPVAEIKALAGKVKGRKGFSVREKELKTKARLLTPGAKMDGGDGTMAVPVAEVPVVAVVPVSVPYMRVIRVSSDVTELPGIYLAGTISLQMPVTGVDGLYMPVNYVERIPILVVSSLSGIADGIYGTYGIFISERNLWAARYGKSRRFLNEDGTEFAPDWGTGLHRMRRELDEDALRYDALIDAYNERVERVQWRKKMLKGQGVSQ